MIRRDKMLDRIRRRNEAWDIIIIGGGATGVGCAVDAASRGFDVLLLEQHDFGKGTSSRSTKIIHGGVRYLKQGNISLVRESLKERAILRRNAPHLVTKQAFVVPCYSHWDRLFYGIGLKFYNLISGNSSFGKSRFLSRQETIESLPNVKQESLAGGIIYFDGQFDDSRLLIDLVNTAAENRACILNYAPVIALTKDANNKIDGAEFQDLETNEPFESFEIKAKLVINATGAFCDGIRKMSGQPKANIIAASQGVHLVFDRSVSSADFAMMLPKTNDGRVLFAIPWNGKVVVGTTDTEIENLELEPKALSGEIDFILETCANYFATPPKREDILSVFTGIRPLVDSKGVSNTASLSRDHTIEIDDSNLLTITGGKWTTYRRMAEDAIDQGIATANLEQIACQTKNLRVNSDKDRLIAEICKEDPACAEKLHPDFEYTKADVIHALRSEMAQTVEDVLARRTRILFLDARAAIEISRNVAELMASELGESRDWIESQVNDFNRVAANFLPSAN